jgi:hypothetical protein
MPSSLHKPANPQNHHQQPQFTTTYQSPHGPAVPSLSPHCHLPVSAGSPKPAPLYRRHLCRRVQLALPSSQAAVLPYHQHTRPPSSPAKPKFRDHSAS